jgi:5-methylcytosine-specific restriction endonuclease McrA
MSDRKEYKKKWYEENKDKIKELNKKRYEENKDKLKEQQKKYNEQNNDKIKEYQKEYREENKDKMKEYYKQYREENKDNLKERDKKYYEKNKDKLKEQQKKYNEQNKDKIYLFSLKRRERKRNLNEKSFTHQHIKQIKQKFENKCFHCSKKEKLALDHFYPLSKGFPLTEDNCIILCKSCNSSKRNKDPSDFFSSEQINILKQKFKITIKSN